MHLRLTGGAANSNVNNSLGGAMSSVQITSGSLNNLWDDVGGLESRDGDVGEYRCFAVLNNDATATMIGTKIWISQEPTNAAIVIDIGLSPTAVGTGSESINNGTNEDLAPSGVTFSHPTTFGGGLSIGNLTPGQRKYVWARRTVTAGAGASQNTTYAVKVACETT